MAEKRIFIIQGRQKADQVEALLRSLDLKVLSWAEAHRMAADAGTATPHTWDIVRKGIDYADVVLGLLTPDDEVRLGDSLHRPGEQAFDIQPMGQARPNVLVEIGYALGTKPKSTVLVQIGKNRPLTDLIGHYIVELSSSVESRRLLIGALKSAGCQVNDSGEGWKTAGNLDIDPVSKPVLYNRFQGNYRGSWRIENYDEVYRKLRPAYEQLMRQAARSNRRVMLAPQIPQGGEATATVLPDGRIIAQLIHGPRAGVLNGTIADNGDLAGFSHYEGEPEVRITGSVGRSSSGGMAVRVTQHQPHIPIAMKIVSILNKF